MSSYNTSTIHICLVGVRRGRVHNSSPILGVMDDEVKFEWREEVLSNVIIHFF